MNTGTILRGALACALGWSAAHAGSTIDTAARHSYGANLGWVDWKWDPATPEGATLEPYLMHGRLYAANVGWIDLGDGTPAGGIYYTHSSGDWGVNHDGLGGLSGWAYGANIGWVLFDQGWKSPPRVDLTTGAMSGYAYSANAGWIGLEGVETTVDEGADTDGDGIPDAWEYEMLAAAGKPADLGILDPSKDNDGDGESDEGEYEADTNPFDRGSFLRVTSIGPSPAAGTVDLSWTFSPRRVYKVSSSTTLSSFSLELDNIFGGSTTISKGSLPPALYFNVEASVPLAP